MPVHACSTEGQNPSIPGHVRSAAIHGTKSHCQIGIPAFFFLECTQVPKPSGFPLIQERVMKEYYENVVSSESPIKQY